MAAKAYSEDELKKAYREAITRLTGTIVPVLAHEISPILSSAYSSGLVGRNAAYSEDAPTRTHTEKTEKFLMIVKSQIDTGVVFYKMFLETIQNTEGTKHIAMMVEMEVWKVLAEMSSCTCGPQIQSPIESSSSHKIGVTHIPAPREENVNSTPLQDTSDSTMVHISLAGYGEVWVQIPKRTLLDEGAIGDSIEESILSQHQTTTSSESALLSGGSSVKGYDKHAAVNVKVKTEEYIRRLHKEMNAMKRKNKTLEKEINSMKKERAADTVFFHNLEKKFF